MMSVCQLLLSSVDSDETTILVKGRLNQTIVVERSGTGCAAELPSADDARYAKSYLRNSARFPIQ